MVGDDAAAWGDEVVRAEEGEVLEREEEEHGPALGAFEREEAAGGWW